MYLAHLLGKLDELHVRSAIIFCSTCKGCHLLSLVLERLGVAAAALHSHKPQQVRRGGGSALGQSSACCRPAQSVCCPARAWQARLAALDRFKSGAVPILLATGGWVARGGVVCRWACGRAHPLTRAPRVRHPRRRGLSRAGHPLG